MSDNFVSGKLKLKGVKEGKVKKKKKSKSVKDKDILAEKLLKVNAADDATVAEDKKEGQSERKITKTKAEIAFMKAKQKSEGDKILKKAQTSHKERVEQFNEHLDNLIEHFDIPKGRSGVKPKVTANNEAQGVNQFIPWVEKYRPKTVNDVSHQEEVVSVLKKCLEGEDIPNLLFYGPPGTGKTSTILALTRQMFGSEFKDRVLELNASDERGIQVVREKIKSFSQIAVNARVVKGLKIPAIKIVILDEADNMTDAAQSALRRTMEKFTRTTRFCLICNYVSRIIAPITSRCAKFRFKPLDTSVLDERIRHICQEEKLNCSDEVIENIRQTSGGDLRKAITYLQSSARLKSGEPIEKQDIHDIAGVVPQSVVEQLVTLTKSASVTKLQIGVEDIMNDAYSASQIIDQLHDMILDDASLSDKQKGIIMEQLSISDKCLLDGADEYLQILSIGTVIMNQYSSS